MNPDERNNTSKQAIFENIIACYDDIENIINYLSRLPTNDQIKLFSLIEPKIDNIRANIHILATRYIELINNPIVGPNPAEKVHSAIIAIQTVVIATIDIIT